jgi:DNA-binding NarL/FixJ family response regulator
MNRVRKFLIIEDEPVWQRTVTQSLSPFGSVHVEGTVAGGLIASRTQSWLGAVVDVRLPDGIGLQVIQELAANDPLTPMLVLTSDGDDDLINQAQRLGASFLRKPTGETHLAAFGRLAVALRWTPDHRLAALVQQFSEDESLSHRESELVAAGIAGHNRSSLAQELGVTENTLKGQIRVLLAKCGAESLDALANNLLRQALR